MTFPFRLTQYIFIRRLCQKVLDTLYIIQLTCFTDMKIYYNIVYVLCLITITHGFLNLCRITDHVLKITHIKMHIIHVCFHIVYFFFIYLTYVSFEKIEQIYLDYFSYKIKKIDVSLFFLPLL